MRTPKIIQNLQRKLEIQKIIKKENQINKHFKVHDGTLYGNSETQMYHAREVIANFARKNNVSVDIYDARRLLDGAETVSPIIEDKYSSKINVVVTNLKNKQQINRVVDANTDITYPKVSIRQIMLNVKNEEDLQIGRKVISSTEDSFLRNLYRNISEMTNQITKTQNK